MNTPCRLGPGLGLFESSQGRAAKFRVALGLAVWGAWAREAMLWSSVTVPAPTTQPAQKGVGLSAHAGKAVLAQGLEAGVTGLGAHC